jgi:hypothetical protein
LHWLRGLCYSAINRFSGLSGSVTLAIHVIIELGIMFSKKILGRDQNEIIENAWRVSRWDLRDNSSLNKWKSKFKTREEGEGCISIEIKLGVNAQDQYLTVTIGLNLSDYINFFKNYIKEKVQLNSGQIHQLNSFPRELSFEMPLNLRSTMPLLEAINTANATVNPEKPIILPMKSLQDELIFIITRISQLSWNISPLFFLI